MKYIHHKNNGQVLLMSIVALGAIFLSATAVAGFLMAFQLRQANDAVNSARAFFAADAQLELETYNVFIEDIGGTKLGVFVGSEFRVDFENGMTSEGKFDEVGNVATIRSWGRSGNTVRQLEAEFEIITP